MNKIATVICAAALTASSIATAQENTAPVAPEVSQAEYGAGLNSAATWTAVGVVIAGALIVDNQQSDATGTNPDE